MIDIQECQQMVDDCEKRESRLSEWEQNFIDSMGRCLGKGKGITDKQAEILNNIWEKATNRG